MPDQQAIRAAIDVRGKRALVMGLGLHGGGLGVARFLAAHGADVTVTDLRGPELLQPSLDALAGYPIRFVLGRHDEADFSAADMVIRNPGVPARSWVSPAPRGRPPPRCWRPQCCARSIPTPS
jgi:UDP-N-acetylmuramoylalanine-D-glutamate ligase